MKFLAPKIQALLAILLPAALMGSLTTVYPRAIVESARSSGTYGAALILILILLVWLEGRWLLTLIRLVRARGDVPAMRRRDADPAVRLRRKRRIHRALVAGASSVLSLTAAELLFRVFDLGAAPALPSLPAVHETDAERNALGLREPWDDLPDDGRLRIAFVGDSMVWGLGVPREETFCHLIEQQMAEDVPQGVVTINLGEPGTGPLSQLERFGPLLERFRPAVVIHVIYLNDLGTHLYPLLQGIYRVRDDELWLSRHLRLAAALERTIRNRIALHRTLQYMRGGATRRQRDRAWEELSRGVEAMRDLVHAAGGVYCLTLMPWLFRLDDYPVRAEHDRLERWAREQNIPYIDLLAEFEGRRAAQLRVSAVDEHPNARGHRIVAECVARFLRSRIRPLMERPRPARPIFPADQGSQPKPGLSTG